MPKLVWSARRQWLGNLIPILCMVPFALAGGALMLRAHRIDALGVGLCALSLVVGWFAVNRFGLFGNESLHREIARRVLAPIGKNASEGVFVGFARPAYLGLLDAHEDLGFLFMGEETIEFVGERHHAILRREEVRTVRFRPNVHSALGLGRWVSVEGIHKGKAVRLLIEPREEPTLLANRKRGANLRSQIQDWTKKERGPSRDPQ